jgi:hypothetical protein
LTSPDGGVAVTISAPTALAAVTYRGKALIASSL